MHVWCNNLLGIYLIRVVVVIRSRNEEKKPVRQSEELMRYVPCLLTTKYALFFHLTKSSNKFQLTQTTFLLAYIFFVCVRLFLVTLGQLNSISGVRKQNKYFSSPTLFFPFSIRLTPHKHTFCVYLPIFRVLFFPYYYFLLLPKNKNELY